MLDLIQQFANTRPICAYTDIGTNIIDLSIPAYTICLYGTHKGTDGERKNKQLRSAAKGFNDKAGK